MILENTISPNEPIIAERTQTTCKTRRTSKSLGKQKIVYAIIYTEKVKPIQTIISLEYPQI